MVGVAHMMGFPVAHLLAAAVGAVMAGSLAWSAQGLRYDARIADIQAAHAAASALAAAQALATTTQMQKDKDEAIARAQERAAQNAAAAAAARRTADSLRTQLASTTDRLANASHATCTQYASAASELLGQCAARYSDVAAAADGHLADVRLMQEAWPSIEVPESSR